MIHTTELQSYFISVEENNQYKNEALNCSIDEIKDALQNNIGDEGALGLSFALANCSKLLSFGLYLPANKIGANGASGIGSILANFTNLKYLEINLSVNEIGDEGASGLGSGLAKCTNLSNLTLDFTSCKIGKNGALGLSSGLANCTHLSNLLLLIQQKQLISFGLQYFQMPK
ncbi:hypothetical protein ABPG74_007990 [Tetrahymena malaccensis]